MSTRLKKIIEETKTPAELNEFDYTFDTYDGESIKIKIKKELTLAERNDFIDQCVKVVFRDGEYRPQDKPLAAALAFLKCYTDVELIDKDGNPTLSDEDIYEFSKSNMYKELASSLLNYTELIAKTNEYVDHIKKDLQLYKAGEIDELISKVNSLVEIVNSFGTVTNEIGADKIREALEVITSGGMDEVTQRVLDNTKAEEAKE